MDISKANKFIYIDHGNHWNDYRVTLYISSDIQKLIYRNGGALSNIYAVLDTDSGPMLFEMDFSYDHDPIIARRFIHESFIMKHYDRCDKIDV